MICKIFNRHQIKISVLAKKCGNVLYVNSLMMVYCLLWRPREAVKSKDMVKLSSSNAAN